MRHRYLYFGFLALLIGSALLSARALADDCQACRSYSGVTAESMDVGPDPLRPDFAAALAGENVSDSGRTNNVAACSGPFCGYDCRSEGIIVAVEMGWLDVHTRGGADMAAALLRLRSPLAPELLNVEPESEPAPRITAGGQTCDGLGVRTRYWEFDGAAARTVPQPAATDPNQAIHAWDVCVFDLEVMLNRMINQTWDITLSTGYRFADYEEAATLVLDNQELALVRSRYYGHGFTGAVEMRRQLWRRLGVVTNGRASLVFGDENTTSTGVMLNPVPPQNVIDARYILETQLAAEYQHPLCGGGYWFARGGIEVQYWDEFAPAVGRIEASAVTFSGFFAAVGLQR